LDRGGRRLLPRRRLSRHGSHHRQSAQGTARILSTSRIRGKRNPAVSRGSPSSQDALPPGQDVQTSRLEGKKVSRPTALKSGAGKGNRTPTVLSDLRILSPLRLPISPSRPCLPDRCQYIAWPPTPRHDLD